MLGMLVTSVDEEVFRKLTLSMNEIINLYRELARQKAELELAQKRIRLLHGLFLFAHHAKKFVMIKVTGRK